MHIFTQKTEGSTLGDSQASQNKTMKFFFCLLWQFGLFLTTFTHKLHSKCLFLANEIAANIKSTSRLKFKSTGLECSDANKTPTTCVELKRHTSWCSFWASPPRQHVCCKQRRSPHHRPFVWSLPLDGTGGRLLVVLKMGLTKTWISSRTKWVGK